MLTRLHSTQVFNKLSFMGANWDLPNCAWDGKACIVPVKPKYVKPLHVPVMNMGYDPPPPSATTPPLSLVRDPCTIKPNGLLFLNGYALDPTTDGKERASGWRSVGRVKHLHGYLARKKLPPARTLQ